MPTSRTDLALIKVEGRTDFRHVKLADTTPRIGDWVIAVGNPFGLGGTVTAGIVSARGRDIGAGHYDDFIQIDAPVNKGNSGGPTFDLDGNVIGINTAIFSPSGGSVGIAFAIPGRDREERDRTAHGQGVGHARLARRADPDHDAGDRRGPRLEAGGRRTRLWNPAGQPGGQGGDRRHAISSWPWMEPRSAIRVTSPSGSARWRREAPSKIDILRKGEEKSLTVALGELPVTREARAAPSGEREAPGSDLSRLGLTLSPGGRGEGVMITGVNPSGLAADGFQIGDVILDVGGRGVATPADVRKALTDARTEGKRSVLMRVKSGEAMKFVAVPLVRG